MSAATNLFQYWKQLHHEKDRSGSNGVQASASPGSEASKGRQAGKNTPVPALDLDRRPSKGTPE